MVEAVGGYRSGFEGSQDYDLTLRVGEVARRVVHIPELDRERSEVSKFKGVYAKEV